MADADGIQHVVHGADLHCLRHLLHAQPGGEGGQGVRGVGHTLGRGRGDGGDRVHRVALRVGTRLLRSKAMNTVPSLLKPSVRVVTMPWLGRDLLGRTARTSERA
jgi:hypothetical protein